MKNFRRSCACSNWKHRSEEDSARRLLSSYDLKLVCVTRGTNGSLLVSADESNEHPGFKVKVADTVGAGDAFTAALVHGYLRGTPLAQINETANRVGAWVASQPGGTPAPKAGDLNQSLAEIALEFEIIPHPCAFPHHCRF